jgi:transcriptional regulator with PAS, ATPase and Fis domain
MPVQVKLLRVLQERTFTSVGSYSQKRFSGRVIAATNQPLDTLRRSGAFREDFFYRLSSDVIVVPPLRQRLRESPAELACLASVVVSRILGFDRPDVTDRVVQTLEDDLPRDYGWPGNVRELEQAVRRILVTGHYRPDESCVSRPGEAELERVLGSLQMSTAELLGRYCAALYAQYGSYEAVARHTQLDRRTVKRYLSRID